MNDFLYISLKLEDIIYHSSSIPTVKGIWRTNRHMCWHWRYSRHPLHRVYQVHPWSILVHLPLLARIQRLNWWHCIDRKLIAFLCMGFNNFFSWFFYGLFCGCSLFLQAPAGPIVLVAFLLIFLALQLLFLDLQKFLLRADLLNSISIFKNLVSKNLGMGGTNLSEAIKI